MYNPHTITLYNKVNTIDDRDVFVGTVLQGVFVNTSIKRAKEESDDTCLVIIPADIVVENKTFIDEKSFESAVDKSKYWTLRCGDFIIVGNVILDNPIYNEVVKDYKSFMINDYKDYSNIGSDKVRHFEVTGK